MINLGSLYRVSQKKSGTADFQYLAGQKCHIFLTSLDKTSSAEENDAKIVKFGWVILNLCTLLEIQSFSNFAGFLGTHEQRILSGQTIHTLSCGSPLFRVSFVATDQRASTKHRMEGLSRHNSSLTGCKNRAKFENDRISRNSNRIKITQLNLNDLVSFSSAEDALSNDVKIYNTFSSQCTENPLFLFFWDTRYNATVVTFCRAYRIANFL